MIQRPLIECFHCKAPVDEADLDCAYCGRDVALEAIERREAAYFLRCAAGAVAGAVVLGAFVFTFLTGFGGHEKTFILSWILAGCIVGLLWIAGDWFNPRKIKA